MKIERKLSVIIFILLLVIIFGSLIQFLYIEDGYNNIKHNTKYYNFCIEYLDENMKQSAIENYPDFAQFATDEECKEITQFKTTSDSAFSLYIDSLITGLNAYIIPFMLPLIITIPFIYIISKKFRSKDIKDYILRKKYKYYVKDIFKLAYKNIWFVPFMIALLFILCFLITKNINPEAGIYFGRADPILITKYNNIYFYIIYLIILFLNIGIYINIGLTILSKNKNFVVSYVETFIVIYLYLCINAIILGNLFQKHFNISAEYFNLFNIYSFTYINNVYIYLIINFINYIITFLVAKYNYKDKEKLIMMCEK